MREVYLKCLTCGKHWTIEQLEQRNENLECEDVLPCACDESSFKVILLESSNA